MNARTLSDSPAIDPRVEFWSDPGSWPRDCTTHVFLARIVQDLGRILYKDWTGDEPGTVLLYPLWANLDSSTPQDDIRCAADTLYYMHQGYRQRADNAMASGQPKPMPTPDEWAIACGLWREISDQSWAAYNRFVGVQRVLVSIFELNFVSTAFRGNLAGEMRPVPHGWWINECFENWFATCQVDPQMPFIRHAVRMGGDWIYVDLDSYLAWRNAAFRAWLEDRAKGPDAVASPKPEVAEAAAPPHQTDDAVSGTAADTTCSGDPEDAADGEPGGNSTKRDAPTSSIDMNNLPQEVSKPSGEIVAGVTADEAASTSVHHQVKPKGSALKPSRPPRKRGTKARFDWPTIETEALRRATADPLPTSIRALTADMLLWCSEKWNKEPSESRARAKITAALNRNGISLD